MTEFIQVKETIDMKSNDTLIETLETIEKRKRQKGVTTVEYAVMLVLVAIAVLAATPGISTAVTDTFGRVVTALTPAA